MAAMLQAGDSFSTWAEFQAALDEFQRSQHIQLTKICSKTIETKNKKLPDGVTRFPSQHVYAYVQFGCIHFGKARSTSSGLRPNQSSFKLGCPAKLYVSSDRKSGKLIIKTVNNDHNHEVSEALKKMYPSERRLEGSLLEEARKLVRLKHLKVDVKVLRDYIHSTTGKQITLKDLHNLKAQLHPGEKETKVSVGGRPKDCKRSINTLCLAKKKRSKKKMGLAGETRVMGKKRPEENTLHQSQPKTRKHAESVDSMSASSTLAAFAAVASTSTAASTLDEPHAMWVVADQYVQGSLSEDKECVHSDAVIPHRATMMSNIEIKARVQDVTTLHKLASELSQSEGTQVVQEDTFFCVPRGRLKLRHLKDRPSELISYDRPDKQGPKESVFTIAEVQNPEQIKLTLDHALGIRGVVRKLRTLYLVGQTRIHVDQVDKLGHYMELEVVMQPGQSAKEGEQIANDLMKKLGVKPCDLIDTAYIDMLEPVS